MKSGSGTKSSAAIGHCARAGCGVEIPPPLGEAGDGLDVEGFVSEIVTADEFVLNTAQRVRITPETRFKGGTRADLVPNASVDVEGSVADDGTLVAREIEIAR